ncbi:DNA-binding transcriptional ArsR family regulator [Paenibacillus sp. V4I9]|nr:DNA-binding transcriptional ArsR family regulator [Paenibacillus sp. V4I9]
MVKDFSSSNRPLRIFMAHAGSDNKERPTATRSNSLRSSLSIKPSMLVFWVSFPCINELMSSSRPTDPTVIVGFPVIARTQPAIGGSEMMNKKDQASVTSTRRAIVTLLKQHGPMDAITLASKLSLTGMAVRQHLYELQNQQVVEYEEEARPMGRPAKIWRLTTVANRWFPNGYLQLSVDLLQSIRASFGEEGIERVLEVKNLTQ